MKRHVLFMGSFDPIHKGHIEVIDRICRVNGVRGGGGTYLHVIPALQNPNKGVGMFRYEARSLFTAISLYKHGGRKSNNIIVDDIEEEMAQNCEGGKLYSFDILSELRRRYKSDMLIWVLTQETYDELLANKWHRSAECLAIPDAIQIINTGGIEEVHSTDIRKAIEEKNYPFMKKHLDEEVYKFLNKYLEKEKHAINIFN